MLHAHVFVHLSAATAQILVGMHFTRRDEYCDKCVMAFGNDMTYEQRGLVLLVYMQSNLQRTAQLALSCL